MPPKRNLKSTKTIGGTGKKRRVNKRVVEKELLIPPKVSLADTPGKNDPSRDNGTPRREENIGAGRSYFESHKGVVRTTHLTLANLNVASAARLEATLANLTDPFQSDQARLESQIVSRFLQFSFMMAADHSLLFYGYGSKRRLLQQFANFLRSSHSVVVVNGFNPTVSLRSVFMHIATDILRLKTYSKRTLLDYVTAISNGINRTNIAVVIHSIDGPTFRSAEAQHALSSLATISGISLIASIDHVNAPLLWDGAIYSRYDWAWIKADTFQSYTAETVFCSKPLLRGGEERRVEGAVALLMSLSERARNVFRELAKKQTEPVKTNDQPTQARVTFNRLFETAKENFLASDPTTLRLILTELETHDLLHRRRGADMAEQLWIPLDPSQLEQVLDQTD